MRDTVYLSLPIDQADELRSAPMQVLAIVATNRIRSADLQSARRWFAALAGSAAAALQLTGAAAEHLLAACDAVYHALDEARIDTAELAVAVEDFRTLRTLVHMACSGAPGRCIHLLQRAA